MASHEHQVLVSDLDSSSMLITVRFWYEGADCAIDLPRRHAGGSVNCSTAASSCPRA